MPSVQAPWGERRRSGNRSDILEGHAILCHRFEAGFPDQGHIARGCCLKSPSEEGGNGIAPDYTNLGQMAAHREKTRKEKQRGTVERAIIQAFRKGIPRRKTEREREGKRDGWRRKEMRVGNQPDKMRRRGGGAIVMDPKLERSEPPAQKKGEQSTVRGGGRSDSFSAAIPGAIDAAYLGIEECNRRNEARTVDKRLEAIKIVNAESGRCLFFPS